MHGERVVLPVDVSAVASVAQGQLLIARQPAFARLFGVLGAVPTIGLNVPLAIVVALISVMHKRTSAWLPWTRMIFVAAVLGAIAFAVSAAVNGSPISTSSVGQFSMCALFILAYRVTILNTMQAARIVGWMSMAMIAYYVFMGPENTQANFGNLWKYGIAYPVAIAVVYWVTQATEKKAWAALALIGLGIFGTLLDYRSYGLVCFAAALISLSKGRGRSGVLKTLIFGGAALLVLATVLPLAMETGVFGSQVQARTAAQSEGDAPLVLGGRTEPPLSLAAIATKPLIGWGNVQEIDRSTISRGSEIAQQFGMGSPSSYVPFWIRDDGRISLHSVFFISWVEGGVLAVIFPTLVAGLFVVAALRSTGRLAPLVTLVCMQGMWDLFFSPWGGNKSVVVAAAVILAAFSLVGLKSMSEDEEPDSCGVVTGQLRSRRPI